MDLSKRCVQFIVKSAIGRFVKEVSKQHLQDPKLTFTGILFELNQLELNDTRVNEELLADVPLRLVSGTINSVKGQLAFLQDETRSLEAEGLHLVFDVTAPKSAPPSATSEKPSAGAPSGQTQHQQTENLYSSLLAGDMTRETIEKEVLEDANATDNDIDHGVDVLSSAIKGMVHSINGVAKDITVRIRVPPPGKHIVPGQDLPANTTEIVLCLPKVVVKDETASAAAGNSFLKRIALTGFYVQALDAAQAMRNVKREVDEDGREFETVRLQTANTVCSGNYVEEENEITIEYVDIGPGHQPNWKAKFECRHLHMLASPLQLARLVRVANFFLRAPDAPGPMDSGDAPVADERSQDLTPLRVSLDIHHLSCSLLETEDPTAVSNCWKRFYAKEIATPQDGLAVPHFGLRVDSLRNRFMRPPVATGGDDIYSEIFNRFGGLQIQFGLGELELTERQPGRPAQPVLRLNKTATGGRAVSASLRTTCPMSRATLKALKMHVPLAVASPAELERIPVARQDIEVFMWSPLELFADVDTLRRVMRFQRIVMCTVFPESLFRTNQGVTSSSGRDAASTSDVFASRNVSAFDLDELSGMRSLNDEDFAALGMSPPPMRLAQSPTRGGTSLLNPPPPPGGMDGPKSDSDAPEEGYRIYRSVRIDAKEICFRMSFLKDHAPDPDIYGPILQRLFRGLRDSSALESHLLRKTLCFRLHHVRASLPFGNIDGIEAVMDSAGLMLVDTITNESTELIKVQFNAQPDKPKGKQAEEPPKKKPGHWNLRLRIGKPETVGHIVRPPPNYFEPQHDDEDVLKREAQLARECNNSIALHAESVHAVLHQDDLLLLLFMIDEITVCATKALEEASEELISASIAAGGGPDAAAGAMFYSVDDGMASSRASSRASSMGRSGVAEIDESTSVELGINFASIRIFASRLSPTNAAVSDPIWMVLSKEERAKIRQDLAFHNYQTDAIGMRVFLLNLSSGPATTMHCNVRTDGIDVHEKLPRVDGLAGFTPPAHRGLSPSFEMLTPIMRSYANLHNRSHNTDTPPAGRRALRVCLRRVTDYDQRNQKIDVRVALDRISFLHQPAHLGDHWMFVLIAFVSDPPEARLVDPAAASDLLRSPSVDSLDSSILPVAPFSCVTNVTVTATDTLVQYRPFTMQALVAVLCPKLVVKTGDIVSSTERMVVTVAIDEIAAYLHDVFPDELLEYDSREGVGSGFGHTRNGIGADLEDMGFVSVMKLQNDDAVALPPNISVRIADVKDKPMFVEIASLHGEMSMAYDSYQKFELIATHFFGSLDLSQIPAPHLLVAGNGSQYVRAAPLVSKGGGPVIKQLVDDVRGRIETLINAKLKDVAPPTEARRPVPFAGASPEAALANASFASTGPRNVNTSFGHGSSATHNEALPAHAHYMVSHVDPVDDDGFVIVPDDVADANTHFRVEYFEGGHAVDEPSVPFSLRNLCKKNKRHFTAGNLGVARSNATLSATPLHNCPPIETEIFIAGLNLDINLYGGMDLESTPGSTEYNMPTEEILRTNYNFTTEFRAQRGAAGGRVYRSSRKTNEVIRAVLRGFTMQIDVFREGEAQAMHMLLNVRDAEILDRIEGSPVNKLLMCSVPPESRDNGGNLFEMRWSTVNARSGVFGGSVHPEERMSMRMQPVALSLHRRSIDLLQDFFLGKPDPTVVNDDVAPSTMFFNKLYVHPLTVTLNVYTEVRDYGGVVNGEAMELINLIPTVEGLRTRTQPVLLFNFPMEEFAEKLIDALTHDYGKFDPLILALCGMQPIRTLREGGTAISELVVTPLDCYRKNKGLYTGVARGLANCTRRLGAEVTRVASDTTRLAHEATHFASAPVRQSDERVLRGDQPRSVGEGLTWAAQEIGGGIKETGEAVKLCFGEGGNMLKLPLTALLPVDGILRGFTQALLGVRNTLRPENRALEANLFKKRQSPQK